jgi:multimeric flavodoxin WrbA
MKIYLINGFDSGEAEKLPLFQTVLDIFSQMEAEVNVLHTGNVQIPYCCGLFNCWVKTPGECSMPGICREIADQMVNSDLMILFTPIVFGGYPARLKRAVDHFIPSILPFFRRLYGETHHIKRYKKYPSFLSLGFLLQKDEQQQMVFRQLFERNRRNFYPPHAACEVFDAEQSLIDQQQALLAVLAKVNLQLEVRV